MRDNGPVTRDVVLVGGGHSHVHVLRRHGMRPARGLRFTVVARDVETPYSGMLPGLVAGHYDHAQAHIDLRPLCRFAGARLYHATADGLDLEARTVHCEGRPPVAFDDVSIDVGSSPDVSAIPGAREHAILVKPVNAFLHAFDALAAALAGAGGPHRVVVIGAGAGGVELALSIRQRLAASGARGVDIRVLTKDAEPLPDHGKRTRARLVAAMRARGVELRCGVEVTGVEPGRVRCAGPGENAMAADTVIVVTGAGAPAWLADTGLDLDTRGFVRVRDTLQSTSHDFVFATGDVAAFARRALPKSGVYAVRQGPALAENLRRRHEQRPLTPYRPQARALALISTGDRNAVASWGGVAFEGPWVWRWKDRIDRRWMRRYQELPDMDAADDEAPMRCGGCGAKVAGDILARVLSDLRPLVRDDVLVGLDGADDAAIVEVPAGRVLVQSVDHFRPFVDDPYIVGRVAAVHCLGDLYAMGAEPQSAQAMVTLAYAPAPKVEDELRQLMSGALEALGEAGVALVGGHTAEGPETVFGLCVNGLADPRRLLRKGGLAPGEALVLTKPLGTGTVLAADMRGAARADEVDAALASMQVSNAGAARVLREHGASACTDVTGFGLAGHLLEMLDASRVDARLDLGSLPALHGALRCLESGIESSLQPANELKGYSVEGRVSSPARRALLFDPQTAGGLLAGIPGERAQDCVAALARAGYPRATVIGRVVGRDGAAAARIRLSE